MTNVIKISQLPAATTPLSGSEEIPVVQSGGTVKATTGYLLDRANQTGEQAISTVTDLQTTLDTKLTKDTEFIAPIAGTATSQVPSSVSARFKDWANAVEDFGVSLFEDDGVTVKDNQAELQAAIDKLQKFNGCLFIPPIQSGASRSYATSELVLRDSSPDYNGKSIAIVGLGAGERTSGQNGRYDVGTGLKLIDGANADFLTSPSNAGKLILENLLIDLNYSGQTGDYHGIVFSDKTPGYGFAGEFKNVYVQGAAKSGVWVGANRSRGKFVDSWVEYCQGASSSAAFFLGSYDWEFTRFGIGVNVGTGMYVGAAAQIQMTEGAFWLNNIGLIVASSCQDISGSHLHFDENAQHGLYVEEYSSASTAGARQFVACKWSDNSASSAGTYSDVYATGNGTILVGPYFEGNDVKYCVENTSSAKVIVVAPAYISSGAKKSYVTDFTNDYANVLVTQSIYSGVRQDASGNLFLYSNGADLIKITDGSAFNFQVLQPQASGSNIKLVLEGKGTGGTQIEDTGGKIGFYGTSPISKGTVTGALSSVTDANAKTVIGNIILSLEALGLISNGTT